LAVAGQRSLAAVAVSGCCVLFPSRYFAGAVLACVRLSSCVSSVSPVVAAVGLAVAASQRLAAVAFGCTRCLDHNQCQPNEVSLSSAGGEERKQQPTTSTIERQSRNQRPQDRCVRARLRCSSRASLPLTPQAGTPTATIGMRPATSLRTKAKSVETTPSGSRKSWVLLRVQRCPRPYRPENALSKKSVREHFQVGRAARRWQSLVGVRWQRWQCRVAAFYFHRVSLPVQFWRAAGCPSQFRPRLPWWQPLVWRWLRLSGWLR
jgi:hypothetical protein